MIIVKEVKSRKEKKDFLNFPLKLYHNNPYFVPPLYVDEKQVFNKNYHYYDTSKAIYFIAYDDKKIVGRISGILQYASNERWNQKRVRFTRFDCIDNQDVANQLFQAVETWAKSNGMNEVAGPLGFSDLEREGLLIEGFDQLSTFEEQYNYDYYQRLIENCGYVKEVDWVERKLKLKEERDERLKRLSSLMLKRYNLHFAYCKSINDFLKKYQDDFFEIVDKTYENIYQTVPFTEKMKENLVKSFKLIVNEKYVATIVDENDKVVAFGLCFPSIAKAINKCQGHLTPIGIIRLLHAIKHPHVIDLGLIGVLPEYQMKGIASALISAVMDMLENKEIEYAETNLNLEDNHNIQNQWKSFDSVIHKRRRAFVKKI